MRVAITGASRGLGKGMGEHLLSLGHQVGFFGRTIKPRTDSSAVWIAGDVTKRSSLIEFKEAMIAAFGGIDVWVNNAGVLEPIKPVRSLEVDELHRHLAVNLDGVLLGSQVFIEHCRDTDESNGVLVNISSGAAKKGYHGWGAYCAGKSAVDRLTECIALEEAEIGLKALSIAPGIVDTDMQALIRSTPENEFPSRPKFIALKAENCFNTPEFVADTMLSWLEELQRDAPLDVCLRVPEQRR